MSTFVYHARSFPTAILIAAIGSIAASSALAEQPFFTGVGTQFDGYYSRAWGVSGDGSVVVGWQESGALLREAFRWTRSSGRVVLGLGLPVAHGISHDGSVIVGDNYRWTLAGGPVSIGEGGITDISADGSTIVGLRATPAGDEAFRWTEAEGTVGIGDLPGGTFGSSAQATSADGSVVVGLGRSASSQPPLWEAFRWTSATGMVGLGDLPGADFGSGANDVSADGSVVVGSSKSGLSFTGGNEAFRWTSAGGMQGLGYPAGEYKHLSVAYAVSADGSIVVGRYHNNPNGFEYEERAFIWDTINGMRRLHDVLTNDFGLNLNGWTLGKARDISADGRTIVGDGYNPQGIEEAWVAHLGSPVPEPASCVLAAALMPAIGLRRLRHQRT